MTHGWRLFNGADATRAAGGRTSGETARERPPGVDRRRAAQRPAHRYERAVWAVYGFLALTLLAYLVSEVVRSPDQSSELVDGWGVCVFEVVACCLCFGRALVTRRGRLVPIVLGLTILAWTLGDIALTIESAGGADPPVPSLADVFYVAFYPLSYLALVVLVRGQLKRLSMATWIDGAVAGLGAAAACAAFVFHGVLRSAGGDSGAVAVNLVYPVGDLLLLVLVVGGTAVLPGRRSRPWLMLAAGYAVNAVGDTFNLFGAGIGATHAGVALDAIAWPTSILLISASVWVRAKPADPRSYERPPGFILPGVATASALLILFVGALHGVNGAALGLAAATLAVAGVRFGYSIVSLRALTEERHCQAVTDQLTTLGNRRALFELLDGLLSDDAVSEEPRRLAFLFVDLDRFKEVNDSFGHSVGDELLTQLGARLKGSLRESDLLVRLGGDEFAVVLLDADADYGATVAQRITAKLEEPFVLGNVRARIGASIGIAVVPGDVTDAHDLLRCADLAMYRAKVDGECFAIYHEDLDGHGNRLGLLDELRVAIERHELELHYQPQVDLVTGEIAACEALIRWPHPRLGYVPPLEFLRLAEEADLIDAITAFVLEDALAQCASWRAEGQLIAVSVNVSTTNLLNAQFGQLVQRLLNRNGLPAEALVLEITETTAMADFDRCKQAIEELRDLGLVVSVDDFGAGFTSLAYLSSLAVGELKLDRSFISGLTGAREGRDLALVQSTINLAHALGLRVVAEGVEDIASFNLLGEIGCDLVQGYLISRPKPAGDLALLPYKPASRSQAELRPVAS